LETERRQTALKAARELAGPLTAIGLYLDAAKRLHDADTTSARKKLGEVIEKSRSQVGVARDLLRQLHDLLRQT
jgi:signal transduction histidine kinase